MPETLKVAIIGGGLSLAHLRAVLSSRLATDLDWVWSDPEIQGVVICSETDRHEPLVLAAARGR